MRKGYYKLLGKPGQYHFVLVAPNKDIIGTSETYKTLLSVRNGIESVQNNSQLHKQFERRYSKNHLPYFVLKAANGEIIFTSEMYPTDTERDTRLRAVILHGNTQTIINEITVK